MNIKQWTIKALRHEAWFPNLAQSGHVSWCCTPPHGMCYQVHKFSIVDAFDTAHGFILGHKDEFAWNLLLGFRFTQVVVTLPTFEPWVKDVSGYPRLAIGKLGNYVIVFDRRKAWHNVGFLAGIRGMVTLRLVQ